MDAASAEAEDGRRRPPITRFHLFVVMVLLILCGGANFVLLKVTYTAYGDHRSFFVNQAINLLYIGYGGIALYPRMMFTKQITPEMYAFPKRHFVVMGALDGLATLFQCLGTAYTPGSLTLLLNQLLIPTTMMVSRLYLHERYGCQETSGAALIVLGACLSIISPLLQEGMSNSGSEARWYAVCLYALSNAPMAMSAVYKEATFDDEQLDVWYVTQWVSIVQFFVSFLFMPFLILPGFGSRDGMTISEVCSALMDGFYCYLERSSSCQEKHTFALLMAFCGVNVCFTTLQLYLTKYGSAVLSALGMSMLLPITTGLFFSPVMGRYEETLSWSSCFTAAGLVLTLCGFGIYQHFTTRVGREDGICEQA
eukprot:CAMPEP_0178393422 /NCGR_PEP_ID=MMETSP0689_2-20121128/12177_1 /TAXON_ID=160604 /ORGANISM="Amphidinium massartii, Strain CS-259" /LENGTH=366 /DNA_ID=CAMNT_0020014009 /DNA_START=63 /DNA_END=1159 /DNA_ORIENTATION=+